MPATITEVTRGIEPRGAASLLTKSEPIALGIEIGQTLTHIAQVGPKGVIGEMLPLDTPGPGQHYEDMLPVLESYAEILTHGERPRAVGVTFNGRLSPDGKEVISTDSRRVPAGLTSETPLLSDISAATRLAEGGVIAAFDRSSSGAIAELVGQRNAGIQGSGDGLFLERRNHNLHAAAWGEDGLVVPYGPNVNVYGPDDLYYQAVGDVLGQYNNGFDIKQIRVAHPTYVYSVPTVEGLHVALAASGGQHPEVRPATYGGKTMLVGAAQGAVELLEGRELDIRHAGLKPAA